jgi:hypothetical protein
MTHIKAKICRIKCSLYEIKKYIYIYIYILDSGLVYTGFGNDSEVKLWACVYMKADMKVV